MKIKLYTLTELKKMHAPDMEKHYVYGILRKNYRTLSRRPREVIYDNGHSYIIAKWEYAVPYTYVKEIINED